MAATEEHLNCAEGDFIAVNLAEDLIKEEREK